MKFDCISFVDNEGKTLLTREPTHPCIQAACDWMALRATHPHVDVLRSFVDDTGAEVHRDMYADILLRDITRPSVRVDVLLSRADNPCAAVDFGDPEQTVLLGNFDAAQTSLLVPDRHALGTAVGILSTEGWQPGMSSRAIRPGDVLVVNSVAHLVLLDSSTKQVTLI